MRSYVLDQWRGDKMKINSVHESLMIELQNRISNNSEKIHHSTIQLKMEDTTGPLDFLATFLRVLKEMGSSKDIFTELYHGRSSILSLFGSPIQGPEGDQNINSDASRMPSSKRRKLEVDAQYNATSWMTNESLLGATSDARADPAETIKKVAILADTTFFV